MCWFSDEFTNHITFRGMVKLIAAPWWRKRLTVTEPNKSFPFGHDNNAIRLPALGSKPPSSPAASFRCSSQFE
jgi:hypothetical protein